MFPSPCLWEHDFAGAPREPTITFKAGFGIALGATLPRCELKKHCKICEATMHDDRAENHNKACRTYFFIQYF